MDTIFIDNIVMEFKYNDKLYSATSYSNDIDIYQWNNEGLCWKIINNKTTLKDILPLVKIKLKQLNK